MGSYSLRCENMIPKTRPCEVRESEDLWHAVLQAVLVKSEIKVRLSETTEVWPHKPGVPQP